MQRQRIVRRPSASATVGLLSGDGSRNSRPSVFWARINFCIFRADRLCQIVREKLHFYSVFLKLNYSFAADTLIRIKNSDKHLVHRCRNK